MALTRGQVSEYLAALNVNEVIELLQSVHPNAVGKKPARSPSLSSSSGFGSVSSDDDVARACTKAVDSSEMPKGTRSSQSSSGFGSISSASLTAKPGMPPAVSSRLTVTSNRKPRKSKQSVGSTTAEANLLQSITSRLSSRQLGVVSAALLRRNGSWNSDMVAASMSMNSNALSAGVSRETTQNREGVRCFHQGVQTEMDMDAIAELEADCDALMEQNADLEAEVTNLKRQKKKPLANLSLESEEPQARGQRQIPVSSSPRNKDASNPDLLNTAMRQQSRRNIAEASGARAGQTAAGQANGRTREGAPQRGQNRKGTKDSEANRWGRKPEHKTTGGSSKGAKVAPFESQVSDQKAAAGRPKSFIARLKGLFFANT